MCSDAAGSRAGTVRTRTTCAVRMMKTRVGVWPTRFLEIETTNRHHVALRGIGTLTRTDASAPC